ncbi:unnamed protein product [Closterium sp. Naga37s-1]|nr:unnamed protein product [Closterium sp. Naga37s-1]
MSAWCLLMTDIHQSLSLIANSWTSSQSVLQKGTESHRPCLLLLSPPLILALLTLIITLPHDVDDLSRSSRTAAAMYLGVSIKNQGLVSYAGEDVGTGLLTYPLLMAADILLYQVRLRFPCASPGASPGGVAGLSRRGGRVFKVPEAMIPPAGARIMSLTDGTSKPVISIVPSVPPSPPCRAAHSGTVLVLTFSFLLASFYPSRSSHHSPCHLLAHLPPCSMEFGNPERPECQNLLSIYQIVTGRTKEKRYEEVTADAAYLDEVLAGGAARANEIADRTLRDTYDALGFLAPPRR